MLVSVQDKFLNVLPNCKIIAFYVKKLKVYIKMSCVSVSYGDQVGLHPLFHY
jgi:hypothetical protein